MAYTRKDIGWSKKRRYYMFDSTTSCTYLHDFGTLQRRFVLNTKFNQSINQSILLTKG